MVDEKMVLRLYCRTAVNIMNAGHDIIPSTVVADICGCSLYRARKIIKKLFYMGLLESSGEGGCEEEQTYIMRGYRLTRQGRKSKQYAKAQWDEAKICSKCFGGGSPYSYFKGFRSSTNLTEEGEKNAQNDRKKINGRNEHDRAGL